MVAFVDDLDRHFGDPLALDHVAAVAAQVPVRVPLVADIDLAEQVSAIAVYGRKSGASTIVTPCRNGASSTLIGVPKTVSPAGIRWIGLAPRREAAHEVGRDDQQVGLAAAGAGRLERVADQVGRAVGRGVGRRGA